MEAIKPISTLSAIAILGAIGVIFYGLDELSRHATAKRKQELAEEERHCRASHCATGRPLMIDGDCECYELSGALPISKEWKPKDSRDAR